jgi:predicted dienelactone hydrolase
VVVISHGTGGSGRDMGWLAHPLVEAGYRVLSVDHHGNNHVDGYRPEGFLFGWERPRDITFVLDTIFGDRELPSIGVAGFSLGGYTAAALAGARIDGAVIRAILTGAVPLPPIEEFPDALEQLGAAITDDSVTELTGRASADLRDPRVRAAFLIAPGLGHLVTDESLAAIDVPVEIRWGDADTTNPFDQDVRPYLERIPHADGREVGPGVGHHDFIAPLTPGRTGIRELVAADAGHFFARHLPRPADGGSAMAPSLRHAEASVPPDLPGGAPQQVDDPAPSGSAVPRRG